MTLRERGMYYFFLSQIQTDIIEILINFAVVDSGSIPTKDDGSYLLW